MSKEPRKEGLAATVKVKPLFAYGKNLFTPQNDLGLGLAEFAGCKNFTETQLKTLKGLGFHIEVESPSF